MVVYGSFGRHGRTEETSRPLKKGALHQSRNERDGRWVLGRIVSDVKLFLLLQRHICIKLSYLDPRIVSRVRPLLGVSRTCAVMINKS